VTCKDEKFEIDVCKVQGQTLTNVIVDLECCTGTESPYIMVSWVKSLSGLLILHLFKPRKIMCCQLQDVRTEMQHLELLQLKMLMELGTMEESIAIQGKLSRTNFRLKIGMGEAIDHTEDGPWQLDQLQADILYLTCAKGDGQDVGTGYEHNEQMYLY